MQLRRSPRNAAREAAKKAAEEQAKKDHEAKKGKEDTKGKKDTKDKNKEKDTQKKKKTEASKVDNSNPEKKRKATSEKKNSQEKKRRFNPDKNEWSPQDIVMRDASDRSKKAAATEPIGEDVIMHDASDPSKKAAGSKKNKKGKPIESDVIMRDASDPSKKAAGSKKNKKGKPIESDVVMTDAPDNTGNRLARLNASGGNVTRKDLSTVDKILKDFEVSYVQPEKTPADKQDQDRRPNFKIPSEPIYDMKKIPAGWSPLDDDVDKSDVDAMIERCEQRIKENIMPQIFELKLQYMKERKEQFKSMIAAEPRGLTWDVVQRLQELQRIKEWLDSENDEFNLVPTINAIMKAYRKKKLEWNQGLVTYWREGTQLCQPRPHDLGVLKTLTDNKYYKKGVWVEGNRLPGPLPPGPANMNANAGNAYAMMAGDSKGKKNAKSADLLCYEPSVAEGPFQIKMNLKVKYPNKNANPWIFEFSDDSGADFTSIYRDDLWVLKNANSTKPFVHELTANEIKQDCPHLGAVESRLADGTTMLSHVLLLTVDMEHPNPDPNADPWSGSFLPVECLLLDGNIEDCGAPRANGPFMRSNYHTTTTNSDKIRLYLINTGKPGTRQ